MATGSSGAPGQVSGPRCPPRSQMAAGSCGAAPRRDGDADAGGASLPPPPPTSRENSASRLPSSARYWLWGGSPSPFPCPMPPPPRAAGSCEAAREAAAGWAMGAA